MTGVTRVEEIEVEPYGDEALDDQELRDIAAAEERARAEIEAGLNP